MRHWHLGLTGLGLLLTAAWLSAEDKKKIFEGNALRAYPRLKNKLRTKAAARA